MTDRRTRPDTRDRILVAAATMLGEEPTARLSVRAVARRAEVSVGSLRHFFPTQRELVDAVVAGLYGLDVPEDPVHDTTRAPAERLVDCLRLLLGQVGTGEQARAHWRGLYDTYVAPDPAEDATAAFVALERLGLHRIEEWLTALADEGALPRSEVERRARFLQTVVGGLAAERALPAAATRLPHEADTLMLAARAVVEGDRGPGGGTA